MSKTISANLKTHIAGEVTTLATCLKLTSLTSPATVLGFTSLDADIIYDGVTYSASTGQTPSELNASITLNVGELDIMGIVSATGFTEADLYAGIFDDAEVELFAVNYMDLTMGRLMLQTGNIGNIRFMQTAYVAEFRNLTQRLQQTIGELYSYTCRAMLGDGRCQVALASFQDSATVTATSDGRTDFSAVNGRADEFFQFGKAVWTTGANTGRVSEIVTHTSGTFTLAYATPYAIEVGDECTLTAGCDKQYVTCRDKFSNLNNFRGEPNIVGVDELYANPPIVSETL